MTKAVAYARYSSDLQSKESIVAQLRAIHTYAYKNGIEIVHEYVDEAFSATTDQRPAFQKMLSEIRQIKPQLVLVHKFDRFARNRYDSAIHKRDIQRAGARLIAVDQPIEDSPEGIILEGLLESMNEYYSKNLGREVMKRLKENAYKAQYNGGNVPLGYDVDQGKHYIINEAEAETVRLIFRLFNQGVAYTNIIRQLNELGLTTKRGQPFGKNSIHDLLRNEKYCGTYIYNKVTSKQLGKRNNHTFKNDKDIIRIENAIPALVTPEEWNQVQIKLNNRRKAPRQMASSPYVLNGIIRCGHCDGAMTGQQNHGRYYVCSKSRVQQCDHKKQYKADVLEEEVISIIETSTTDKKHLDKLVDLLYQELKWVNSQKTEAEMLRTPNFGRKSLNEIKEVLAQMGLHLGMEVPGWPPENIEELAKRFEDHY